MKYTWHLRWVVPVLLVGAVLWQALFATSGLKATTDFVNRTPYFDVLLPAARAQRLEGGIALVQEPVYVDVRLPLRATSVTLSLSTTANSVPVKVGVQRSASFELLFPEAEVTTDGDSRTYRVKVSDFPYLRPNSTLRFVLSVPGLAPGAVVVTQAEVSFERARFSFKAL
jgi:hypothetical protein